MRILIVNRCVLPLPAVQGGAVETLIESYLEENDKKYHDEIDVVSVPIPTEMQKKIKKYKYSNFIYIKNKSINSLYNLCHRTIKKLGKYIGDYFINSAIKEIKNSKKEYDIIVCENEPVYVMLLKKHFKGKVVLHLHNDFLNRETPFYEDIIQSCDLILPVSNYIKKRVNCPKKCITTYNGIDLKLFKNNSNSKLKKQYNINDKDFIYSYIGRVSKDKGINELTDAFIKLNDKYKDIKLFIIGDPIGSPNSKVAEKDYFYNSLLKKKNNNMIFTGYIDNKKLYQYIDITNVQVIPSIVNEAFGLVAIEALAMDKRLIVTDAGALPEITNKKYGRIVKRENLTNNLYTAMEEEYLNRKKNKNCLNNLKQFSKEEYAKRLHDNLMTLK